jgi:outer membrane protein assembly factor BamB
MPAARCLLAVLLLGFAAEASAAVAIADANLAWPQYRGPNRNGISPDKGLFTNLKDGAQQLWKASLGTGFTSIAVANGMVFACGNTKDQDTLFAFDAESGVPAWNYTYPSKLDPNQYEGGPNATPTVAGNAIYGFSKEGFAYCLEAKTGKEIWKKNIAQEVGGERPGASPAPPPSRAGRCTSTSASTAAASTAPLARWCGRPPATRPATPPPCPSRPSNPPAC